MQRTPEVVYFAAMSLDGFIATEDGGVDWLDPFQGKEGDYGFSRMYGSIDGIVMGSATYEFLLDHLPWGMADRPSWVFTRRDLEVVDPSITLTRQQPEELMVELAARGHERLWLAGGGRLASSFRRAGWISRYEVTVIPVVLGAGIPLLEPGEGRDELVLSEVERFDDGPVLLTYEARQVASRSGARIR